MPLFLTLFSLLITAAIAASTGWLAGYCLAIRQHQASLAKLIGKADTSQNNSAANDPLAGWVFRQSTRFTLAEAITEGLGLDADKITRDLQTRIGISLKKLGCQKIAYRAPYTRQAQIYYTTPAAE